MPGLAEQVWREPEPVSVPPEVLEVAGHPLLAELLVRRGYTTAEAARAFLDPAARRSTEPRDLPGVEAAVARLRQAVERGEKVLVWGDFDADGQTATAVLVLALRRAGIEPTWYLPDRLVESHGLNGAAIERAREVGATLLVTCDCGVGDLDHIAALAEVGVDTIVTDHHPPTSALDGSYPACAVVSPHLLPRGHAARQISGVGVAYFVAAGLLEALGLPSEDLLDLVALGTIADVAPLVGENRHLCQRGLPRLNLGVRPGIGALLDVAKARARDPVDAEPAGWVLAPRLNAFGRLRQAYPALELLLTEDHARAAELAAQADELNGERQRLTEEVLAEAIRRIGALLPAEEFMGERDAYEWDVVTENAVALGDPSWPAGIIGLAAGRIADAYYRPVVLAACPEDGPARVSMRNGGWCDLTKVVAELRADESLGFHGGGHHGAGGGSLPRENLTAFARAFERACAGQRPPGPLRREVRAEAELNVKDAGLAVCDAIGRLAPFGAGNRPPLLLVRRVKLTGPKRIIGADGRHVALAFRDRAGWLARALWWDGAEEPIPDGWLDLLVTCERREHEGMIESRLMLKAVRSAESDGVSASDGRVDGAREKLRELQRQIVAAAEASGDGTVAVETLGVRVETLEAGLACLAAAAVLRARLVDGRVVVEAAPGLPAARPTIPSRLFAGWLRALAREMPS